MLGLMRYAGGEHGALKMVHVPTEEQEDERRPTRELTALAKEKTRHASRIRCLLALEGLSFAKELTFQRNVTQMEGFVEKAITPRGKPLPPHLRSELLAEAERLHLVLERIGQLEKRLADQARHGTGKVPDLARMLQALSGIGLRSSFVFVTELFAWRQFTSGKQVGAFAGLTPTPYDTGNSRREQGISKSGNRWVRRIARGTSTTSR